MYDVYILKSLADNNLYVGCTSDLEKRLSEHKNGKVKSTRRRRPLVLVYYHEYPDKGEAFSQERFLKSLYGYKTKYKLIKDFNQQISF